MKIQSIRSVFSFIFSGYSISICALMVGSCSTAVFHSDLDPYQSGLSYFLPKTLVTIKIEPIGYKSGKVVTQLHPSKVDKANSQGAVEEKVVIEGVPYYVLVNAKGALTQDLITSLKIQPIDDISHVPDPQYNYILKYNSNKFSSDYICIAVDNDSLLDYVDSANKDETGNVLITLAKFAGQFARPESFTTTKGQQALGQPLVFKIDPFNGDDLRAIEKTINATYPDLRNRFKIRIKGVPELMQPHDKYECPPDKICYRRSIPIQIALLDRDFGYISIQKADVVNRGAIHTIDVTRAMLVEKITRIDFDHGMLTQFVVDKPSEGVEAAKLPATIWETAFVSATAPIAELGKTVTPKADISSLLTITSNYDTALGKTKDLGKNIVDFGDSVSNSADPNASKRGSLKPPCED